MTEEPWEVPVLEELMGGMVYPPTPDLLPAVLGRISPPHRADKRLWRGAFALVAALVVGVVLTILVSREARDAVAEFLGGAGFGLRRADRVRRADRAVGRDFLRGEHGEVDREHEVGDELVLGSLPLNASSRRLEPLRGDVDEIIARAGIESNAVVAGAVGRGVL